MTGQGYLCMLVGWPDSVPVIFMQRNSTYRETTLGTIFRIKGMILLWGVPGEYFREGVR